jgi:pimeloyl-ACP methyl ester carboxylesterase
LLAVVVAVSAIASAQQPPLPPVQLPAAVGYTVFVKLVPVGSEQIAVRRGADGWTIVSSGRMGAPIDIVARRVQVRYTDDWKPLELNVDSTVRGQLLTIETIVTGTTAQTHTVNGSQSSDKTDPIAADALLLPSPFWGPFEALAQRLRTAAPNSTIPAYGGTTAFTIRVGESSGDQIQTTERLIQVRRTPITLTGQSTPLDAEIWGDESGHLLRLTIPAQGIDVVREDIASVAARRVTISRPNDESVKILANGFSLAATVSKPAESTAKTLAAVVLVGGSGPVDRDETAFNIPIFGQLAGSLADAGFLVVRYDKRGIGQSGGRAESATLADYAEDLRAVVKYVKDRKDVDRKHIAVVGHSEGGSVAMLAAAKDKEIAALVLIATTGVTGAELNLQQVQHALERSSKTEAEKQATIDLQKRIQQAVLTGSGWDTIPPSLRKQAETPWFQSFLAFDPAKVMPSIRQPILIVQGMLDTQVLPSNADRLEELARARKNAPPVEVVKVPGVNHLLVPAPTGEYDEYRTLTDKRVSAAVTNAIITWLQKTFAAPPK